MSIKVKGLFEDIGGAGRVTELRRKKLAKRKQQARSQGSDPRACRQAASCGNEIPLRFGDGRITQRKNLPL